MECKLDEYWGLGRFWKWEFWLRASVRALMGFEGYRALALSLGQHRAGKSAQQRGGAGEKELCMHYSDLLRPTSFRACMLIII